MKNKFTDVMSKKSDADLQSIVTSLKDGYQPEALDAAKKELENRRLKPETPTIYTDDEMEEAPYFMEESVASSQKEESQSKKKLITVPPESVNNRYPALRIISGLYRTLSWLVAILTILVSGYMLIEGEGGIYLGIGALVGGGILFITLLSIAEGIIVFVDIEHNTRMSAKNSGK